MSESQAPKGFHAIAAIDFSALGDRTVAEALQMCARYSQAQLHVIAVGTDEDEAVRLPGTEERVLPHEEANELARRHTAALVEEFQQQHGPLDMERIAVYVAVGHPAERIVALATAVDADIIVMGTHGRTGIKRIFLGSVAEEVVRRAPCGVYVIRPRDFLAGEKVPDIQPPLKPGEHSLRPFEHRPTYHYVQRRASSSIMPAV